MKKILVIGCPGGGKSTFAQALGEKTGIPVYHLDLMYWNEDKTTVERRIFLERLNGALRAESYIIDGHYYSTLEYRLKASDTVFFLDYPTEVCIEGVRERVGKPRTDMPWQETEEDLSFLDYVKAFYKEQRPRVLALLEKYGDKKIITFKSREEATSYIMKI